MKTLHKTDKRQNKANEGYKKTMKINNSRNHQNKSNPTKTQALSNTKE